MTTISAVEKLDTDKAYAGSYYTIIGAGGSLNEWVEGYTNLLKEHGIGTPKCFFVCEGADVNAFAEKKRGGEIYPSDKFQDDLVFLLFPLKDLDVPVLAMFKLAHEDRWFDDIVDNMRLA